MMMPARIRETVVFCIGFISTVTCFVILNRQICGSLWKNGMMVSGIAVNSNKEQIILNTEQFRQTQPNTCGLAALAYVLTKWGKYTTESDLIEEGAVLTREGISLLALMEVARKQGLHAKGEKMNSKALALSSKPIIAFIHGDHYVVVEAVNGDDIFYFDPSDGQYRSLQRKHFERSWQGIVLKLLPGPIHFMKTAS